MSGSAVLTAGVDGARRPGREAWGEIGMGLAATGGGGASGPVLAAGGYGLLAACGAAAAALVPVLTRGARWSARPAPARR